AEATLCGNPRNQLGAREFGSSCAIESATELATIRRQSRCDPARDRSDRVSPLADLAFLHRRTNQFHFPGASPVSCKVFGAAELEEHWRARALTCCHAVLGRASHAKY